jgi:hypothetical protein
MAFKIFAVQGDEQFTRFNRAGISAELIDYDGPIAG